MNLKPGERILSLLMENWGRYYTNAELRKELDLDRSVVRRNALRLADTDTVNMKLVRDSRSGQLVFAYAYVGWG